MSAQRSSMVLEGYTLKKVAGGPSLISAHLFLMSPPLHI